MRTVACCLASACAAAPCGPGFCSYRVPDRPHLLALVVFARIAETFVSDPQFRGQRPLPSTPGSMS